MNIDIIVAWCVCDLIRVREYGRTFMDMPRLMNNVSSVLLPSKYAYSGGASYAIYETVGKISVQKNQI